MMSYYANQLRKLVLRFILFTGVVLSMAYLPPVTLAQQPQNDATKAVDILAQVNAWRVESGLWPLTINPTLDALALAQAAFVYPNVLNIEDESQYHLDAKGRNPRDRAAAAGWPIYSSNPAHIEVGENAGVGTAKFVMKFWHESAIHAKAVLSTTYREVGVVALPLKGGGYFYLMDFGARPGVLPVGVSEDGQHLWLTDENSRYAKVKGGTKVRLLDAAGNPLTDAVSWSPSIALPDGIAAESVQVVFINGNTEIKSSIQSGSLVSAPAAVPTVIAVVATATATPADVVANSTAVSATRTPDVKATVAAPSPTVAALPAIDPAKADILLTYDANALFLRNVGKNALDLTGLSLIGSGVTLGTPLWMKVADFPAAAFPAAHCLAAQLSSADVAFPSTCKWVRSLVTLSPAKLFWTQGDFIVSFNGTALVTCKASDGQCAIDLP